MNKALRKKPAKQPLRYAVRKMKLDDVVIDPIGRVENYGTKGRLLAPLEILFAILRRDSQCIERRRPCRVS